MKVSDLIEEGKRPTVSIFKCNCGTEKKFVCNKKTYNFKHNVDQDAKNAISNYKCNECGDRGNGTLRTTDAYNGEEKYGSKD